LDVLGGHAVAGSISKRATRRRELREEGSDLAAVPHSWDYATWPKGVWPHDAKRAQWVVKSHRQELVAAGALSRVGKTIIILGRPWVRWVERGVVNVSQFRSNNPRMRGAATTEQSLAR
jgi:hypothetical protein